MPFAANTAYMNSISVAEEPTHPGNREIEHRIRSAIRWNAAAIVLRANKVSSELGGHIASFQSAATLYDTGFMHFWHAPSENHGGDLVFVQGHSSPGIYARLPRGSAHRGAAPELPPGGRRQVSPPIRTRGSCPTSGSSRRCRWGSGRSWPSTRRGSGRRRARPRRHRHVWVFCGDGEMDEPESLGAISLAGREKDNLIFVINCNLQRLDGPVRGNGKIIQELEAAGAAAGTSSRWCGARTGTSCSPRTRPGGCASSWRSASTANTRTSSRAAPTSARSSSGGIPDGGDGRRLVGRAHLETDARRARSLEGPRGLQGGGRGQAGPPSSSPRPSRATAWARPAKAR